MVTLVVPNLLRRLFIFVHFSFRQILRDCNCLAILVDQLRSSSLTIVSNACGTLWNFSARCSEDQQALWDMGAVPMLDSLTHSKHKTIATCSAAALKNLTNAKPIQRPLAKANANNNVPASRSCLPSLEARKRRNLVLELDQELLAETCDNVDESPKDSGESTSASEEDDEENSKSSSRANPSNHRRSDSKDSLSSTPPSINSDMVFDHLRSVCSLDRHRPVPEEEEESLIKHPRQQQPQPLPRQLHATATTTTTKRPLELSKSQKHFFFKPTQDVSHENGNSSSSSLLLEQQHHSDVNNHPGPVIPEKCGSSSQSSSKLLANGGSISSESSSPSSSTTTTMITVDAGKSLYWKPPPGCSSSSSSIKPVSGCGGAMINNYMEQRSEGIMTFGSSGLRDAKERIILSPSNLPAFESTVDEVEDESPRDYSQGFQVIIIIII